MLYIFMVIERQIQFLGLFKMFAKCKQNMQTDVYYATESLHFMCDIRSSFYAQISLLTIRLIYLLSFFLLDDHTLQLYFISIFIRYFFAFYSFLNLLTFWHL